MPTSKSDNEDLMLNYAAALLYYGIETDFRVDIAKSEGVFTFLHMDTGTQYQEHVSMFMFEQAASPAKMMKHVFQKALTELSLHTMEALAEGELKPHPHTEVKGKAGGWAVKQGVPYHQYGWDFISKDEVQVNEPTLTLEKLNEIAKEISEKMKYTYHTGGYVSGGYTKSGADETEQSVTKNFNMNQRVKCRDCGEKYYLKMGIIHMNDEEKMTREEIADYLESQDIDLKMKQTASTGGE